MPAAAFRAVVPRDGRFPSFRPVAYIQRRATSMVVTDPWRRPAMDHPINTTSAVLWPRAEDVGSASGCHGMLLAGPAPARPHHVRRKRKPKWGTPSEANRKFIRHLLADPRRVDHGASAFV